MISGLKYFAGAVHGSKSNSKRKAAPSESDKIESKRKYEANRSERKFMDSWKEGRPWLLFDHEKNHMTCTLCVDHFANGPNQNLNLHGQNKFITGCSNKKLSTIVAQTS